MIKRICFFSNRYSTHRQDRAAYAEKYLPKNIELFFLTPKTHNKYKFSRIKIIRVEGGKLKFVLALRKFCQKNKIDLLINLGTHQESFALFLATFLTRTKYIIEIVGNIIYLPRVNPSLKYKFFLYLQNLLLIIPFVFSKKIIFVTEDIKELVQKYYPLFARKMYSIESIMDEKLFRPENKTKARKKLKLPLNKKIVIFVGRIEYMKGSDIMLKLIKNNQDKLFILIGEIKDKKIKNLRADNLILIPCLEQRQLVHYYNASDLCIFPSRTEGYGLVPREAMLCQTPALVSKIPSLGKIEPALKADINPRSFQKQMDKFFSMSKKERDKLGKICRKYIIERTSYKNLYRKHRDIILN